eukprot:403344473
MNSGYCINQEDYQIICDGCGFKWIDDDILNYIRKRNPLSSIKQEIQIKLNQFHNVIFNQPCPGCGTYISKDAGCAHMKCSKCQHEFCWHCMSLYKDQQHSQEFEKVCPSKQVVEVLLVIFLALLLNMKLCYSFYWVIQQVFLLILSFIALPLLTGVYYLIYDLIVDTRLYHRAYFLLYWAFYLLMSFTGLYLIIGAIVMAFDGIRYLIKNRILKAILAFVFCCGFCRTKEERTREEQGHKHEKKENCYQDKKIGWKHKAEEQQHIRHNFKHHRTNFQVMHKNMR